MLLYREQRRLGSRLGGGVRSDAARHTARGDLYAAANGDGVLSLRLGG